MAVAPTAPPTKSPSSSPEAPRRRRVLHWVVGVVGTLAFVLVAWVFPAVYHDRYDPATKAGATPAVVNDPAWHPVPTPEQDQAYLQQTRTSAAHPGAAVEGRDGFLFLGDDYMANFAQAMGRRYYSREEVQTTVDAEKNRDAWLAKRGIASELFVVPAKWSIYPDKLPAWTDGQVLPHVLDQLVTADCLVPGPPPRAIAGPVDGGHVLQAQQPLDPVRRLRRVPGDRRTVAEGPPGGRAAGRSHPERHDDGGRQQRVRRDHRGPRPEQLDPADLRPAAAPYTVVKPDGSRTTVPGTR